MNNARELSEARQAEVDKLWDSIIDTDGSVEDFDVKAEEQFGDFVMVEEPPESYNFAHGGVQLLLDLGATVVNYPPFIDTGEGDYFMVWLTPELKAVYHPAATGNQQ